MTDFIDDLGNLTTEAQNPDSVHLDQLSSTEFVELMNREDAKVVSAVAQVKVEIARAIDLITEHLRRGGRLVYLGAGTSGRLGVLDASECPPTFRTPPEKVVGIIAGGEPALTRAMEGAEDQAHLGVIDLQKIGFTERDVLVGITSSGRTPYVLGAVEWARNLGAKTIGISCNEEARLNAIVEVAIVPVVGPEVLSGSTRLKAGTATKLVLNMLTTGAMVKLGKTYGNLMVDLRASNQKLRARAIRILQNLTELTTNQAQALLQACQGEVKTAIVCHLAKMEPETARQQLQKADGRINEVLNKRSNALIPEYPSMLLGIDGGGTSTTALLAEFTEAGYRIIGKGLAGSSNRQSVGDITALHSLNRAVRQAFQSAGLTPGKVAAVYLGLAGADRGTDKEVFLKWCRSTQMAHNVHVTNDAELLFSLGTPDGWGLVIVAGTGSIAYGKNATGQTMRAGGWGYKLGDAGSSYAIALEALQTACTELDLQTNLDGQPLSPANALWPVIQKAWQLKNPSELLQKVYRSNLDRATLASLAPAILDAYFQGNCDAAEVVEHQAISLAGDAAIVMRKLFQSVPEVPVVLGGGLFQYFPSYGDFIISELKRCLRTEDNRCPFGKICTVTEPAEGAVKMAWKEILRTRS